MKLDWIDLNTKPKALIWILLALVISKLFSLLIVHINFCFSKTERPKSQRNHGFFLTPFLVFDSVYLHHLHTLID